ncbi:hypothetical protein phiPsa267_135 [Pseudomonas phage phiPsa267]|uniref:Uncharacterized protein n=1 Tax=Pseudomonas phage phiPsa267 TaxID=1460361 RepID=A0A7G9V162_9CAUD|nr:hypothetical protein QGX19_gp095 [Pseudomonas phage phiPsa267]QNO00018.1 hypothetical protein phiPsa267_135 [Pseudomonas phage phiPsa267]
MNKYVARLKKRDKDGRLLRKLGRHANLTAAYNFALEKFGKDAVSSVKLVENK